MKSECNGSAKRSGDADSSVVMSKGLLSNSSIINLSYLDTVSKRLNTSSNFYDTCSSIFVLLTLDAFQNNILKGIS